MIDIIDEKDVMKIGHEIVGEIEGVTEISFEDATCLPGRGIRLDKEQDIYTNDLPQEERKSALLRIFRMLEK